VHGLVGVVPGRNSHTSTCKTRQAKWSLVPASGLKYVDVGAPLPATAEKAKGFNISLVAVLENPEDALVYAEHPAHEK